MEAIKLSNGIEMPNMVMATNWMEYPQLRTIMAAGLNAGFRAIDTARDYGNESIVGRAFEDVLKETGLHRKEIFVTTKIGNGQQKKGDIANEIEISLNSLRTDYIDLWLMHYHILTFISTHGIKWKKSIRQERSKPLEWQIAMCDI